MSKLFLVNIDLNGNELDNAVIQPLAVAPQNPQTTTTITLNLDGNLFNNDKLW